MEGDGDVVCLRGVVGPDGPIRLWRRKRKAEKVAIVLGTLPIVIAQQGDPRERAGKWSCHRIRFRVGNQRAGGASGDGLAIAPTAAGIGADRHSRQGMRYIVVRGLDDIRPVSKGAGRGHSGEEDSDKRPGIVKSFGSSHGISYSGGTRKRRGL